MQLWPQHTHTWYMWQKKFPSPWVHVILWWMQFFRKAQEFLERRGEKLTLFINSMGQTGHHEGDGSDLYPLRLSVHQPGNHGTSLSYQLLGSRSRRIMNFRPALDPLQAEDQTGLCEYLACPWRCFLFLFPAAGEATAPSGTWMEVISSSADRWWSGFTASGTLGSSTVVFFKSDSLKVQSFMVEQSQGRSMR